MSEKDTMTQPAAEAAPVRPTVVNPRTGRTVLRDGKIGRRVVAAMSRAEISKHIEHHSAAAMVRHRDLLKTDLSDEALLNILRQVVDLQLDRSRALEDIVPPAPPKLVRTSRRWVVRPPPPSDSDSDIST